MKICLAVLWISFAVANPIHGEIEFDQFRKLKIREIQEHLRLVQEDPLDAIEYFNLGLAYMAMGRHRKEIDSYLKAIQIDSNYAKAHFNLAMAYDILKNSEAAISHARKAEILYGRKRKHRQVRKVRRLLNVLNEKYK
jgi:tetratricopeptide (TPR) repeat protein